MPVYTLVLDQTDNSYLNDVIFLLLFQNTVVLSSAIIVTLGSMIICIHFLKVDHETLLIIRSLGVQVSSSFASGRECTSFIEMSKIKDIVINEAVYMVSLLKELNKLAVK